MKKLSLLALSMISTFFLFSQTPGTLDLSFGDNGVSLVDFGGSSNYCYASDIMPDQKIVLGGKTNNSTSDISFSRLNADGSLDVSFGSNGIITFVFGGSEDHIYDVLAQPDGKTLAIGYTCNGGDCNMIIVRLNVNGLMDPTFSNDGMLIVNFGLGYESFGMELALQDDGKIIGLGYLMDLNYDRRCALCRINPDGSMDASFGTNGLVIQNFLSYDYNYTSGVALQGENIVVGGNSHDDGTDYVTLARFLPNGLLDASFGINGTVSIELNINPWLISSIGAMCMDNQNRILYGCYFESLLNDDLAIYRFLPDGNPDNSFGDYGLSVIDLESDAYIHAITSQYDGKIIAGGGDGGNFVIVRCQENGDLDPSFGASGDGIVISEAGSSLYSLNLQEDGLIIAAGVEYNGTASSSDFVAARFYSGLNVGIEANLENSLDLSIYPNPVNDHADISFKLQHPARVKTEILNASGMIIASISDEYFTEGEHHLRWNSESMAAGIYIIKMTVDDMIFTSKLVKTQ